MFKEVESHFANLPRTEIRRSRFRRPHTVKFTGNFGGLIPFYVDEVLPSDTFKISYSTVARLSTAIHPTMDNAYMDVYFFYVPSRILWENFEKFLGANDDPWTQDVEYTIPQYKVGWIDDGISQQSLMDYFGFSPERVDAILGSSSTFSSDEKQMMISFNALPLRAYVKIWNDWFRDENLQYAETEYKGDTDGIDASKYSLFDPDHEVLPVNKYHDYFSSALPAPQKHADVLLPLGQDAPVITKSGGFHWNDGSKPSGTQPSGLEPIYFNGFVGDSGDAGAMGITASGMAGAVTDSAGSMDMGELVDSALSPLEGSNLFADLSKATAATVNQLRLAIQTQRLFERDARGGTRMTEILASHFGVHSPDGRLQRSEYLGGKRIPLNMDQILQTSETSTTPLGSTAGWSLTAARDRGIIKSFVEPGYILGLCCFRTDQTYSQGIEKLWSRKKRLDFYYPVLAHIGETAILNKEIFFGDGHDEEAFGYQEAWADYRYKPSRVAGYFRPDVPGSLSSWTYTQKYTSRPTLGSNWIKQGKTEVDNTLVVGSGSAPQVLVDMFLDLECTRPMPTYSIPGLMDHF